MFSEGLMPDERSDDELAEPLPMRTYQPHDTMAGPTTRTSRANRAVHLVSAGLPGMIKQRWERMMIKQN